MLRQTKLSNFELIWQCIVFFAIMFSAIEAPLSFTLEIPFTHWDFSIFQILSDVLISSVFFADMILNVKKREKLKRPGIGMKKPGPLFLDLSRIIDVVAIIPFDLLAYMFGVSPGIAGLRLLRMIRIVKIINMISLLGNLAVPRILKIQFSIICAMIALNWIACGWIMIYPNSGGDSFTIHNKALYWAVTTLTTIGYGDITPSDNIGRIYTMIIMILGVGVYGFVIGNVSRIISLADRYKEQSRQKLQDMGQFMRHYNIPDQLRYAAFSYYNHLFTKRLTDNDSKIISELPNALQAELQTYMNLKLISNVPAFKLCSHNCLKEIAASLEQTYLSPGQTIFHKGEIGKEMYIIGHGVIEMIVNSNVISTLHEGQCFGESALLEETKRNSDVKASTYCDLYKFSKVDCQRIIKKHPELLKSMKKIMSKRSTDRRS